MDRCQIFHCDHPAAIMLPTICDDVALCKEHARPILAVSDLIPGQRQRQDVTVEQQ